jgi:hypothetical protein
LPVSSVSVFNENSSLDFLSSRRDELFKSHSFIAFSILVLAFILGCFFKSSFLCQKSGFSSIYLYNVLGLILAYKQHSSSVKLIENQCSNFVRTSLSIADGLQVGFQVGFDAILLVCY